MRHLGTLRTRVMEKQQAAALGHKENKDRGALPSSLSNSSSVVASQPHPLAADLLLSQIVARTLKNMLREVMRESLEEQAEPSDFLCKLRIVAFLNLVCGKSCLIRCKLI